MSPVNERLVEILREYVPDEEQAQRLHDRLVARENHALDGLRVAAAQQGLMPSITQVILVQTGLGSPIDPETWTLLNQQAEREVSELNEAIRRFRGQT